MILSKTIKVQNEIILTLKQNCLIENKMLFKIESEHDERDSVRDSVRNSWGRLFWMINYLSEAGSDEDHHHYHEEREEKEK